MMSGFAARSLAIIAVKSFRSGEKVSLPSTLIPCASAFLLQYAVIPFITGLSWVTKKMDCGFGVCFETMSKYRSDQRGTTGNGVPHRYLSPRSYSAGEATLAATMGILCFSAIGGTGPPRDDQSGPTKKSTLSTVAIFS